jgi:AcrR family transcriptional regulator
MSSSPDPIQAQFIAARRNQILDAAIKVFAAKGFHAATIKEIAVEAGIAYGSIYTYFENKTALLLGIFDRMKASIMQEHPPSALAVNDVPALIKTIQLPLMVLKDENLALFRVVLAEMMVNEALRTRYYQHIMEPMLALAEATFQELAQQNGLSLIQFHLTIRALSGMIFGLLLEYLMGDPLLATQWETLPDVLAPFILKGFDQA